MPTIRLPPAGPLQTLMAASQANTVGRGLWLSRSAPVLHPQRGSSGHVGRAGLTVAGLIGLLASVPFGHLADRRAAPAGPGAAAASYLLVHSFR